MLEGKPHQATGTTEQRPENRDLVVSGLDEKEEQVACQAHRKC